MLEAHADRQHALGEEALLRWLPASGILDGDLIKLAVGTLLVVDAVDGLVR